MGCQTGYYLVVSGTPTVEEIIDLLEATMNEALTVTEVPAATEKECGQAKLHDLEGAKRLMRYWLSQPKEELKKCLARKQRFRRHMSEPLFFQLATHR